MRRASENILSVWDCFRLQIGRQPHPGEVRLERHGGCIYNAVEFVYNTYPSGYVCSSFLFSFIQYGVYVRREKPVWIVVMLLILGLMYAVWTHRPVQGLRYLQPHEPAGASRGGVPGEAGGCARAGRLLLQPYRGGSTDVCRPFALCVETGTEPWGYCRADRGAEAAYPQGGAAAEAPLLRPVYGYLYPCEAFAPRMRMHPAAAARKQTRPCRPRHCGGCRRHSPAGSAAEASRSAGKRKTEQPGCLSAALSV